MSENPKGRTEDTKKLAEKNISEGEPPLHKEDPTQPVKAENASSSAKAKTSSDSPVELWGQSSSSVSKALFGVPCQVSA